MRLNIQIFVLNLLLIICQIGAHRHSLQKTVMLISSVYCTVLVVLSRFVLVSFLEAEPRNASSCHMVVDLVKIR